MVSGDTWPEGDPFLQRQNEPSIAASTRNPLHLLAGSNDYRTVDLPGLRHRRNRRRLAGPLQVVRRRPALDQQPAAGLSAGRSLQPAEDDEPRSGQCAIYGYGAGADAVVRAGTNGLIYYAGLAFDRSLPATPTCPARARSSSRASSTTTTRKTATRSQYLGTRKLQTDPGGATGNFLDKPWMAVDIPRNNARCTIVTPSDERPDHPARSRRPALRRLHAQVHRRPGRALRRVLHDVDQLRRQRGRRRCASTTRRIASTRARRWPSIRATATCISPGAASTSKATTTR